MVANSCGIGISHFPPAGKCLSYNPNFMATKKQSPTTNAKAKDLALDTEESKDQFLTTNQGLKINDDQNSLKAGERGATLLEDFIMREKITHFDHERIPERI